MRNIKNRILENPTNAAIILISVIAFIVGVYALNIWISLLIVGLLNLICFWKPIIKLLRKNTKPKIKKEKKKADKPIYEYKVGNEVISTKDKDMKKSKKKKEKKKRGIGWKILQVFIILGCLATIAAICAAVAFAMYIVKNAPDFNPDNLYSVEPSVIYYANGEVMAKVGTEKRVILRYDEIPEVLINALIATEDANFFQHNGVDLARFFVASVKQVLGNSDAGGASTLTMQLSKNYVTQNKVDEGWEGIVRKFTDIYMSVFMIETTYTKEEILEFYINSGQIGSAYGVEAAAQLYFNKSAKDINISEAAILVSMYKAPRLYDPIFNPENSERRRQTVLYLMHRHGYITDEEYDIAMKMTVERTVNVREGAANSSDEIDDKVRSAVDTVVKEVIKKTGKDPRLTSMKIYTTIDKKMQNHVGGIMTGETYKWENKNVQAGISVIDVKTGALVAIGGNRDNKKNNNFNHATEIDYQIGSTSKPLFDYAPAIEYLNWSTGTVIADEKITYSDGTSVNNWDGKYSGFMTIRNGLKLSRNIPALKTFQKLENAKILSFVKSLGLNPEDYLHEAHSIGGYNGESPLSLSAAYAAFANGGYYTEPYTVTKVVITDSGETYNNRSNTKQVMSDSTAFMITTILQEAASYGLDTGSYYNVNGVKYAAKTGTTNFDPPTIKKNKLPSGAVKDYWVAGYNTEYSIAIWYGYDSVKEGYNKLGSKQHARIFQAVAKGIFTNKSAWKQPDSVVKVKIETDNATLMLPSEYTPSAYTKEELFVKGTEPTTVSTRFAKLKDVTNLQATVDPGTINLSWSPIETPDSLNFDLLKQQNKSAYSTDSALTSYVNSLIKKNKSVMGNLGYNVYVKTAEGLTLLGWTANPYYTVTGYTGEITIVVKSSYSIMKTNMSDGRTITTTVY
jgi:Membrane carboxypeptidase (penicillin-binding protein)